MRRKPKCGDVAWFVSWCASVPLDENGDADLDRADERFEIYLEADTASRRARKLAEKSADFFGQVEIGQVQFTAYDEADSVRYPHVGYWEPFGTSVYIENEQSHVESNP